MVHSNIVFRRILTLALLFTGLVFTNGTINHIQLVRAQTISTTINEYPVPKGSDPWGTTTDSKGRVWVALPGCDPSPMCSNTTPPGRFDVFNPATSSWVASHHLPAGYAQPLFLAFDKQGVLWFPMPMDNSIGMYNLSSHTYQKWPVPTAGAGPWDLAIDSNGIIWFTEHYTNKIGRFDPVTHSFSEISTPSANSEPYGITIDHSGNVWFTENNSSVALIAEYTVQNQLLEYKIRNSFDGGLTPHLITVDPNGNIWWTEGFVGEIGELKIAQALPGTNNGVTEYSYPKVVGCNSNTSHTSGIAVDSNGLVWFDDSLQCTFGSFPDSGKGSFTMNSTPTSYSHPHDGLIVDSHNRIWFDEEFANKLARVTNT
jgi:virginiamycin B lyase